MLTSQPGLRSYILSYIYCDLASYIIVDPLTVLSADKKFEQ